VRIYRSVTPDRLGELLADRLTGSSFIDKAVDVETNYVYTVRAVNRLGTESAANQQLAVAVGTPAAEVDKPSRAFGELQPPQVRGRQLMFVTVPLVPEQAGALADYNRYDHQVMHWDPATDSWIEDANSQPGQAYFIWSNGKNVQEITGKEVPQRPFPIELKKGWNMVGNPFRFTVKLLRTGSLRAYATDPAGTLPWLTAPLESFGERLGTALFRIPAGQERDEERLLRLLASWPLAVPLAIEAQEPSWHVDETHAILRGAGVTLVVTDTDEAPDPPLTVTGRQVYLRLRRTLYGTADLDAWAARLEPFLADGRDAYVFFRHDERGTTPGYAIALAERLARYAPAR
jgi:uncharacterized protein YecE (DUF72 family)